jgi:sortase A
MHRTAPCGVPAIAKRGGRAFGRVLFVLVALVGLTMAAQAAWNPAKAQLAQVLLDRAFEQSLASGEKVRPWSWADTAPVARISVPRLGVSQVVLSGASGEAMAFGPTEQLSGPVTVYSAHRDTHFAFIRDARVGHAVEVQSVDGLERHFRIIALSTVRWDEFAYPRNPGKPLLALTTCWPFGATESGPLRRVAWAEEI